MIFEIVPFARPEGYGEGIMPLADLKAWLAIEESETELDDLLKALRDGAIDMVESYCELRLGECAGLQWKAEALPCPFRLPVSPVTAVTGFAYLDGDGAAQTFAAANLRIGARGQVLPVAGEDWPGDIDGGIVVTFTAGFTAANRPPALVKAVKVFAAHLFENREAVVATGSVGGEVPLSFKALVAPWVPVAI